MQNEPTRINGPIPLARKTVQGLEGYAHQITWTRHHCTNETEPASSRCKEVIYSTHDNLQTCYRTQCCST